jgi:hypothetical protein
VDRVRDLGWIVVQRRSVVYSKLLNEGELVEGKAQWRIGRTFWP